MAQLLYKDTDLEQNVDQYMFYYRFFRFEHNNMSKKPSAERYKVLVELRNKQHKYQDSLIKAGK